MRRGNKEDVAAAAEECPQSDLTKILLEYDQRHGQAAAKAEQVYQGYHNHYDYFDRPAAVIYQPTAKQALGLDEESSFNIDRAMRDYYNYGEENK